MGNLCLFGKNKQPESQKQPQQHQQLSQVTDKEKTVLRMKVAQDKLLAQKRSIQKNSEKAYDEAKQFAIQKNKDRAKFALRRKKLYDGFLIDTENQLTILQKTILEVEHALQTSEYIQILDEANNLLKDIDVAGQLEKMQDIASDMKERDQDTQNFNKLFKEYHTDDVDDLYKQFESEVVDQDIADVNKIKLENVVEPKKSPAKVEKKKPELAIEIPEDEKKPDIVAEEPDEINEQLQMLV